VEETQAFTALAMQTGLEVVNDFYAARKRDYDRQIDDKRKALDPDNPQQYNQSMTELRALERARDNPTIPQWAARTVTLASSVAASGKIDTGAAATNAALGFFGESWDKAGQGFNETKVLKISCTSTPEQCAAIKLDPNADPTTRVQQLEAQGMKLEWVDQAPTGASTLASNGVWNDEARAAQLAVGNTGSDTVYLRSNDYKGVLSDLIGAGWDRLVSPVNGEYSATTNGLAGDIMTQGRANVTVSGHSRGSIVVNNALNVAADERYTNSNVNVMVFGPAISPSTSVDSTLRIGGMQDATPAEQASWLTGGGVIDDAHLQYHNNPKDPVATFVGATWMPSPYLQEGNPLHLPFSSQGNILQSLIHFQEVLRSGCSAHSAYGLNCAGSRNQWPPQAIQMGPAAQPGSGQ
jgi:filamentous hemagglutinin